MDLLNPASVAVGQFSTATLLIQDALRELGESAPSTVLALEEKRYLNYANRVLNDVNSHPYFHDVIKGRFTDQTGSITVDTNTLTLTGGDVLGIGTPVQVVGAGRGGGDLYTFVLEYDTTEKTTYLAHAAGTTVAGAAVKSPYKGYLRLYTAVGDTRAVDDRVLVDGIKHYATLDDVDSDRPGPVQLYNTVYWQQLNTWLARLVGGYGELEVEPRDA